MGCCHSKNNIAGIPEEPTNTEDPIQKIQNARHKTDELSVSMQHRIDLANHHTAQSHTTTQGSETTFTDTAISKEMLLSWKQKIEELSSEIVVIEQERKVADLEYKTKTLTFKREIASLRADNHSQQQLLDQKDQIMAKTNRNVAEMVDCIATLRKEEQRRRQRLETKKGILHKVAGDSVSKLKFNSKLHPKTVLFVSRINHLFYFDVDSEQSKSPKSPKTGDTKRMDILNITVDHEGINDKMERPWFFVLGTKRSALFVVESDSERDEWVQFITDSLKLEGRRKDSVPISIPFGHSQSPINIDTKRVQSVNDSVSSSEDGGLRVEYPSKIGNLSISNDGVTVKVHVDYQQNRCRIYCRGKWFILERIEFHTPSEHMVDGRQYEMEMQLIHRAEDDEEVGDHGMAVMAFLFSTTMKYKKPMKTLSKMRKQNMERKSPRNSHRNPNGHREQLHAVSDSENGSDFKMDTDGKEEDLGQFYMDSKGKENDFLKQFWNELPMEKTEKAVAMKSVIEFDSLWESVSAAMKPNSESDVVDIEMEMFEYTGSLTLAPFNERVLWMIARRAQFIDNKQLNKLSSCWNHESNARDLQEVFDRNIYLRPNCTLRI